MTAVARLTAELGAGKVLTGSADVALRRHDAWVLSELRDVEKRGNPPPACVVRPEGVEDVVRVVNACRETATPLLPFGLGSGVCGALVTTPAAVVLDMGAMSRVRRIDPTNLLAAFDAGVRGTDAEGELESAGLTLGHYPQSIGVSSVGGWVATRAAGQFSTAYGNVEDLLFAVEAVLPDGSVFRSRETPRASAGPDLKHLLLGSEGTLGVITGVTFSVRQKPEKRALLAFHVPDMNAGFELQRAVVQRGYLPAVLRQYDATETTRMFAAHARGNDALLLAVCEGPALRVEADAVGIAGIAREAGASEASTDAVEHWLSERNHVPTFRSFLENGVILDTIEVAATWDRIERVYTSAVAALSEVPGLLAGSAHSSHVYRSGLNLYFTFAAKPEAGKMEETYLECWRRVMQATSDAGGGVAHHHGIGRIRKAWLTSEIGEAGVAALRAVKKALDPVGFMNPGALFPD